MERIQQHKFVDLATPVKQPRESKGMNRSDFLAMATGVAAATAMAPEAFARNFIDQYDLWPNCALSQPRCHRPRQTLQ